ncbi:signal peptide peptidase SppA [Adlercreutzia sp. R25]|uniref:Signal peptide peptidase SppA n=1 Tax=Adlercreutzia shanghongiae TaxID=3111773 RepID=A0ABU6J0M2_9ACTN|nr:MULTISPECIES: signal peptide peptidase SppA [unclassified Adlercreutzia]MEC4273392.1 signal peptide peptidase SppA [Adlercreutzia sp. R25]MEC4295570.1 signal peptide peptidase SppA [Adlercreutzia sp. R22]
MTEQNQWQNAAWGSAPQSGAPQPQPVPQSGQPQPQPQAQPHPAQPYGYGAAQPQPAYAPQAQAQGIYAAPAQPQKRRGWIVGLAAVLTVLVLGIATIGSCTSVFTSSMGAFSYESPSWTETVAGDTVGIINISGTIQYDGTTSSPEGLKAQLDAAEQNPHIKAVVLRVNSGGGVATAGEEMSAYIRDFSKPVVVSSASINASAAYMISSQADYIFTDKTTSIGSIGVIMSVTDLSGLYEKLGISIENITSADAKDSGAGNRPLTEEERAWYQDQVDQINEVFIQTVSEGRDMPVDEVRALATGLTFTGMDAVENGLADELGTQEAAVAKACELAGISDADTVYLQSSSSDLSRLLDIMGTQDSQDLSEALKELENRVGLEG